MYRWQNGLFGSVRVGSVIVLIPRVGWLEAEERTYARPGGLARFPCIASDYPCSLVALARIEDVDRAPIPSAGRIGPVCGMGPQVNLCQCCQADDAGIERDDDAFRPCVGRRFRLDEALVDADDAAQCLEDALGAPMAPTAKTDLLHRHSPAPPTAHIVELVTWRRRSSLAKPTRE